MYRLATFGFSDMMDCRAQVREMIDVETSTFGEAAERVVRFFRDRFVDAEGEPVFPLVRLFKTHPFAELDDDLKSFAMEIEPEAHDLAGLRCLVLAATDGEQPEWRSRHSSRGHKAIPLSSEQAVAAAPMISQLIEQFGIPVASVIRPDPLLLLDMQETAYNVFHVQKAPGSPYIVAQQEFVVPYGIQSVIGFGGMLATGDLFALILFSREQITPAVADSFKIIGLNLKIAMMRVARKSLFVRTDERLRPRSPFPGP